MGYHSLCLSRFQLLSVLWLLFVLCCSTCAPQAVMAPIKEYSQPALPPETTFLLLTKSDGVPPFVDVWFEDVTGEKNPTLRVTRGTTVRIILMNVDGHTHDFAIPDLAVFSDQVSTRGAASSITVLAPQTRERVELTYLCRVSWHSFGGMKGKLIVGDG
jgi:nitrite reductase (NO-forming)